MSSISVGGHISVLPSISGSPWTDQLVLHGVDDDFFEQCFNCILFLRFSIFISNMVWRPVLSLVG